MIEVSFSKQISNLNSSSVLPISVYFAWLTYFQHTIGEKELQNNYKARSMSEHWNDRYFPATNQRQQLLAVWPIRILDQLRQSSESWCDTLQLLLTIDQRHLGSVIIIITLGGEQRWKLHGYRSSPDNITITSSFTDQSSVQIIKWWQGDDTSADVGGQWSRAGPTLQWFHSWH